MCTLAIPQVQLLPPLSTNPAYNFSFYIMSYLSARVRTTALDVSPDYYPRATENLLQIPPINVDTNNCYCVPLFPCSHLHNHKRANAENSLRCIILHCNFCIEDE